MATIVLLRSLVGPAQSDAYSGLSNGPKLYRLPLVRHHLVLHLTLVFVARYESIVYGWLSTGESERS